MGIALGLLRHGRDNFLRRNSNFCIGPRFHFPLLCKGMAKLKRRVLIADSSISVQKLVHLSLAGTDFEVITASEAQDAELKARRMKPEIVLLDEGLQEIGGLELAKKLKTEAVLAEVRVILLQKNRTDEGSPLSGIDLVLSKPFESKALLDAIRRVMEKPPVGLEKQASEEKLKEVESDSSDEEETVIRAEGPFSQFRKLEEQNLGSRDQRLEQIASEIFSASGSTDESKLGSEEITKEENLSEQMSTEVVTKEEALPENFRHENSSEQVQASVSDETRENPCPNTVVPASGVSQDELQGLIEEKIKNYLSSQEAQQEVQRVFETKISSMIEKQVEEKVRKWVASELPPLAEKLLKEEISKYAQS